MRYEVEVEREYGPFPGASAVHGVTFDGTNVWFASGEELVAFSPESGTKARGLAVACNAGTASIGPNTRTSRRARRFSC